jgi:oxygen-dependent protoporphyrinogen oxidase
VGGVLSTVHQDGFQVEQSADNFITTVPWGIDLCKRIGLGDQLMQTNPACRHTCVVRKGRLYKLPDGFLMMAPTRMWPMAVTPILSPLGKLRAALEYFIPPRKTGGDESMAAFVRRRLGKEVFERLVEPLVSGVYAADMERLSLEATLSQFREMELQYGSLIRAMRHRMRQQPKGESSDSGARYSLFVTPRNGLSSMVDAVAARLPQGVVRLGADVQRLERAPDGGWRLVGPGLPDDPAERTFDAVIFATSATSAAKLLTPVDPELGGLLGGIEHSGTAIVSVGFRREQVAHPLNGMGAVVPAIENSPILAISFSSQKYAHRAPEGHVLLRVFLGGAKRPELAEMPDEELLPLVLGQLDRLLGARGQPVFSWIAHWPGTMPQYHVGHKGVVEQIRARVETLPGIALAGNYLQGVGIPHCIHTGQQAAESVLGRQEK